MQRLIEVRLLVAIVTLSEELNFTRAAKRRRRHTGATAETSPAVTAAAGRRTQSRGSRKREPL